MGDEATNWRALVQDLQALVPADQKLYVKPGTSPADLIVRKLRAAPGTFPKFLLVGARGGGKSTELRAIARALDAHARTVEVDLDRSGVNASSVSAYDLLYISALALLRHIPAAEAQGLFDELSLAYAGDKERQKQLGDMKTALSGIADFAGAASKLAGVATVALGAVAAPAAAGLGVVSIGLRLLADRSGVVDETSPTGRALQSICEKIARRTRGADLHPICVMIDGLEKINGEAGERFRQVFEQTRLLADTPWAAVIAAPPCTLTETNAAAARGYHTQPIWGFPPGEESGLKALLERRFQDSHLDPAMVVEAGELDRIAEMSGGLPRHAVQIAYEAVMRALSEGAPKLTHAHVEAGIDSVGQTLARGLHEGHLDILKRVATTGKLPRDEDAATLFGDGRILVYPPLPHTRLPRFAVHPLLKADIDAYTPEA